MGSGGREREREAESAPAFLPDSWIDSIGLLLLGAHLFLSLLLSCHTKHRPYESLPPFRSQRQRPLSLSLSLLLQGVAATFIRYDERVPS
jgi:hypothetical protein